MSSEAPNPPRHAPARVVPFRGLRFAEVAHLGERTFVPPQSWSEYDDLDKSSLDEHHLLRLLEPVAGTFGSAGHAEVVAGLLDHWLEEGAVAFDEEPAMYVYRRRGQGHTLLGVITAVLLADEQGPTMLGHEQVLERLVDAQCRLELTSNAQLEPIVTICGSGTPEAPGAPRLADAVGSVLAGTPLCQVVDDDAVHELWSVTDAAVHAAVDAVARSGPMLIADGHHRFEAWSATAAAGRVTVSEAETPSAYALTMLVDGADDRADSSPGDGLRLGPVHRVVTGVDLEKAIRAVPVDAVPLDSAAEAEAYLHSGPVGRCVLASAGSYVAVTPQRSTGAPACASPECAVCWLHVSWLPAWGVTETSVEYVHAPAAAEALARERDGIAVLLPSPGLGTVLEAASRGTPLPHKATSFGPKPRVGLVMRRWQAR